MTRAGRFSLDRLAPWRIGLLAIALGLALAAHAGWLPNAIAWQVETSLRDSLLRRLATPREEQRLVIVDIDEASLQKVGSWPWPRARLADLAEILLATQEARAVGFDMVLPEGGEALADRRLAALAASRRLVLAQAFDFVPRTPAIAVGQVAGATDAPGHVPAMPATGFVANHAGLAAARCIGNIGFVPDADGQIRRQPLLIRHGGATYPSLALALATCPPGGAAAAEVLAHQRPEADGSWRIPYERKMSAYASISAADVFSGRLPAGMLTGKVALVGSSALGLGDRVATPLDANAAGVMVHAQSYSALLDGIDTEPAESLSTAWLGWTLLSAMAIWAAIMRGGKLGLVLTATAAALGGWFVLGQVLVAARSPIPISSPLWAYASLLAFYLPAEWSWSQQRAREATQLLSRYVAQPVLSELMQQQHHGDALAPKLREITVLIADMQNYTRLTAASSLEQGAALTKDFLDHLTRPVLDLGGTLDKYTGDGLVAFWGAPLPVKDHASRAVAAARLILGRIRTFNEARARVGLPPALARIGIASGTALVGDLGTPFRSTYTAVGDCINTAARLEAKAKELGVLTLVAASTRAACPDVAFTSLGEVKLRGLQHAEEVFTLVGD